MKAGRIASLILESVEKIGEETGIAPLELIGGFGGGILALAGIDTAGKTPEQVMGELKKLRKQQVASMNTEVDRLQQAFQQAKAEGR